MGDDAIKRYESIRKEIQAVLDTECKAAKKVRLIANILQDYPVS